MPWAHLGDIVVVSIFSVTCQHTRKWCGQHHVYTSFPSSRIIQAPISTAGRHQTTTCQDAIFFFFLTSHVVTDCVKVAYWMRRFPDKFTRIMALQVTWKELLHIHVYASQNKESNNSQLLLSSFLTILSVKKKQLKHVVLCL